jgi:hypothetical protein
MATMKENLNLFLETAQSNREEAKRIFFGEKFKDYYLQGEDKLREEYDQLLYGKNQNQILDEFLVCAGAKAPEIEKEDHPSEESEFEAIENVPDLLEQEEMTVWKMAEELYLKFRCTELNLEEFCEKAYDLVADEYSTLSSLFRFQIAILSGRSEEEENRMMQLLEERPWEDGLLEESYYFYLKALYEKSPSVTKEAFSRILENETKDYEHRQYYAWMHLYLDEEIVFSMKKQMELLYDVADSQELLPILKYEVVSIWNRNPALLKEIDTFTIDWMTFGWEREILSKEVCAKYARLVRRMPEFSKEAFELLEKIYGEYHEEEYLQSICRVIVRAGQWNPKYHVYLQEAVKQSMKMNGLFEAYIRTMDKREFQMIEPAALHYFSYSNSLSEDETAYLYANITKNEKEYGVIAQSYQVRIELFVMDAMKKGYMSDIYVSLYRHYLPRLIEENAVVGALPNILFKQKISCKDLRMESLVIKHFEKQQPDIYELHDGKAYCDIYSDRYIATFYDGGGNPYIASVDWEMEPVLSDNEYYKLCRNENLSHEKIIVKETVKFCRKEQITSDEVEYARQLLNCQIISGQAREIILELLLQYFYENQNQEKLEEYLKQVRWEKVQEKNQIAMIEYFISQGNYEEAVKGMERFGFEEIHHELLGKVANYLLEKLKGRKSLFLTHMCEILFLNGNEEPEILTYLQQNIPEDADYRIALWMKGKEAGIYDADYTCYLILKAVEDETLSEEIEEIFLEYVKYENDSEQLSHMVLEEFGKWYFTGERQFLPEFTEYLTGFLALHGWRNIHYPMAWLYEMSKKEQFLATERELIEKMIEELMEQEIYVSFLLKFEDHISLPKKLYCISYVTYRGNPGCQVMMHCQTDQNGIIWEMPMKEVIDGNYIGYFTPFVDEHPDVYVTMDGDEKKYRKSVTVEDGLRKSKGLKYHKINEMLAMIQSDHVYEKMNEFEETQYLLEQSLKPWY